MHSATSTTQRKFWPAGHTNFQGGHEDGKHGAVSLLRISSRVPSHGPSCRRPLHMQQVRPYHPSRRCEIRLPLCEMPQASPSSRVSCLKGGKGCDPGTHTHTRVWIAPESFEGILDFQEDSLFIEDPYDGPAKQDIRHRIQQGCICWAGQRREHTLVYHLMP